MAVAFDAAGTTFIGQAAVTSVSQTFMTVGSGSNRALIALFEFGGGTSIPASLVCHWDSAGTNQAFTQITGATASQTTGGGTCCVLFGLVAPTTGNKNFTASWTGARDAGVTLVSFTGVDQTGGATSFPNGTGNSNSGTANNPATVTVTSTSSDAICAIFVDNNTQASATFSDNQIDGYFSGNSMDGGANYAVGTGTHALTCTWASSCNWAASGTSIKSAASITTAAAAAAGSGAAQGVGASSSVTTATAAGTGIAAGASVAGYILPDADSVDGGWTNESGGTSLYASIDEYLTPADTDYIRSSQTPSSDVCKISLGDPGSGTIAQPFGVSYRYGKVGLPGLSLVVQLMQGTTQIASWSHNIAAGPAAGPATIRQVLGSAQFNAITDFTNLFLQFTAGPQLVTALDPVSLSTHLTLSNGNLTFSNVTGLSGIARSTTSYANANLYYEITCNAFGFDSYIGLGATNINHCPRDGAPGEDNNSIGYYNGDGNVYAATLGTILGNAGTYAPGDVIGVAARIASSGGGIATIKAWFRKNGGNWNNDVIANQDPANNIGGFSYTFAAADTVSAMAGTDGSADQETFNFGATTYQSAAPAGFSNW
jgi:hypothetical protein